jgi:YHYH protein
MKPNLHRSLPMKIFPLMMLVTLSQPALAADTYDDKTGILTIPSAVSGSTTYTNVTIQVGQILSVGSTPSSFPSDVYNAATKQLTIADVLAFGKHHYNVRITVAKILTVGGSYYNAATGSVGCNINQSGNQLLVYRNNNTNVSATLPFNYAWTCNATANTRTLVSNGVPDHSVANGAFATAISAQSINQSLTLVPAIATAIQNVGGGQPPGYAINGVKFDPGTAGTCQSSATSVSSGCNYAGGGGAWSMEALSGGISGWVFDFGVDDNQGHVQPNGQYHYHGTPKGLIEKLNPVANTMTLVGWAADGFPIYSRIGYSTATDKNSALKVIASSYQLKSVPDAGRPAASLFPLGSFTQDWQYVAGAGDLDQCNGRFDVTPEFPDGIYHYYITDGYPYIQRCVAGTVAASTAPQGGGPPPR